MQGNFGGIFDQLFLRFFLQNFHRRCLSPFSIPWCKKVKNDQKLKSKGGPALNDWVPFFVVCVGLYHSARVFGCCRTSLTSISVRRKMIFRYSSRTGRVSPRFRSACKTLSLSHLQLTRRSCFCLWSTTLFISCNRNPFLRTSLRLSGHCDQTERTFLKLQFSEHSNIWAYNDTLRLK